MTRRHLRLLGPLLGLISISQHLAAQAPATPVALDDAAIRQLLVTRVDGERRNAGIVVGVLSPAGRRIVAYGRASLDQTRPLDGDTVFEIGSVTKVFTAMLLADSVRRGDARLTDPVLSYLPITAPPPTGRGITLVDLATHTSGLPLWPSGVPATRDGAVSMARYSEAQLFEYLSTFAVPEDVGRRWAYSNVDAGVLGLALARRAGTTYGDLLSARLTGPLGMRSTTVTVPEDRRPRLADGYDAGLQPAPRWLVPALEGAGSLHSTANDLLMLLDAIARDTAPVTGLLPIMLATQRPGPGIPQALGWWVISTGPGDAGILAHDGGTLGFSSALAYDPATRSGVVVLSNTAAGIGDLARHLLRPAIPLSRPAGAAPAKTEIAIDPASLDRLIGRYEPGPNLVFEVTRDGDSLMLQLPGIPKLRLRPESPRSFFVAENTRITVTFDLDAEERATSLTFTAPTGTTRARFVGGR
jgi:serine-type D-Ala-D-Ala carboxypeptidase/endopeptidase